MFSIRNMKTVSDDALEETIAFLKDNPSEGVRLRPENVHRDAIDSGFAIEVRQDDEMVGCSFIYQYSGDETNTVYGEIGTMRVVSTGYGMQSFLAYFHMLQLYIQDYSLTNSTVFAVATPGSDSEKNLRDRAGMVDWIPPEALERLREQSGVPFIKGKSVLRADLNTIKLAKESLKEWHQGGNLFRTPKTGSFITIDIKGFTASMLDIDIDIDIDID